MTTAQWEYSLRRSIRKAAITAVRDVLDPRDQKVASDEWDDGDRTWQGKEVAQICRQEYRKIRELLERYLRTGL